MAIVAGMFWIFFGVFYFLYKLGSEECEGGAKGGIVMMLIPIAVLAIMGGIPYLLSLIFGDGGVVGFQIVFLVCLFYFRAKWKREEREEKRKWKEYREELKKEVLAEQKEQAKKTEGESDDTPRV